MNRHLGAGVVWAALTYGLIGLYVGVVLVTAVSQAQRDPDTSRLPESEYRADLRWSVYMGVVWPYLLWWRYRVGRKMRRGQEAQQ